MKRAIVESTIVFACTVLSACTVTEAPRRPTPRITEGTMVGGVTATTARVWFRVEPSASVEVECSTDPEHSAAFTCSERAVRTTPRSDFTGIARLEGLEPDTTYRYRLRVDGQARTEHPVPSFRTFPLSADSATLGFLADLDESRPAPIFSRMADVDPGVVVLVGDFPHGDATRLAAMRDMRRRIRDASTPAGAHFRGMLERFPIVYVWDDHDYGSGNSDRTFAGRSDALQVYAEYWPAYDRPSPESGIWHHFDYGGLIEILLLDLRSQRDPSHEGPPSDPGKSMLGAAQAEWLRERLLRSSAPWKVIVSTVPWNITNLKDDAWWSYQAERRELLRWIEEQQIGGVVVVSGDIHTGGGLDDGTHAGLPEMTLPAVNGRPPSCRANVPFPDGPRQRVSCGSWSHGFRRRGDGFGLIRATPDRLTLEVRESSAEVLYSLSIERRRS